MITSVAAVVRLLRPEQWLKNGFVAAPMVFAGLFLDPAAWWRCTLAVVGFCVASSLTYVLNDLIDRDADRAHPEKCRRPIASGEVGPATAALVMLVLAALTGTVAVMLGGRFPLVVAVYLGLTTAYSLALKRAVFVDVMLVALGFVLRVVGGAVAVGVPVSRWLLLCTFLLALYLALGKRRAELVLLGAEAGNHRAVLGHYTLPLVDQAISVVLGATVLAYTLYTVAEDTVAKVGSEGLMATVPVVLYGLFRYLYVLHRHELGGSPARVLLTDRPLLACVLLWLAMSAAVLTVL